MLIKKDFVKIESKNGRLYLVFLNEEGEETGTPIPPEQWCLTKGL